MSQYAAVAIFGLGAYITLCNFYLSFIRYPIHRLRGGTRESYSWISGLPLLGSAFLWLAAYLTSWPTLMWVALVLSVFDTAGLHVFIATIAWYENLHKPRRKVT
jgi:hypothetical protein